MRTGPGAQRSVIEVGDATTDGATSIVVCNPLLVKITH